MRKHLVISTLIVLGTVQSFPASAQAEVKSKCTDARQLPRIEFQTNGLRLGDTVSLSKLKEQKTVRVAVPGDTGNTGFEVLTFTCILITRDGPKKVVVNGNSFVPVLGILSCAQPGNFLYFTDIKVQMVGGDSAVFLENKSSWLKD